eukprot:TRINITY_DN22353_c0_g1_i1.p1 TRINITY_DN22353_c0_g1~~TRINITY_DN22353_c0_g1_i1.p1  ORF type:complete len:244 (+),score=79.54 TRINITY_DN22353_c0_g1_i1:59-790(+)
MDKVYSGSVEMVEKWVKLTSTIVGRDKLMRLTQFGSKFVYNSPLGTSPATVQLLKRVEGNISLARKLFRLGKTMDFFLAFQKGMTVKNTTDRVLGLMRSGSLALWLLFDHMVWLSRLGLIKNDTATSAKRSAFFWFLGLVAGLTKALITLFRSYAKECALKKSLKEAEEEAPSDTEAPSSDAVSDELKAVIAARPQQFLDAAQLTLDLPLPLATIGAPIAPAVVGLCGAVTSVIALIPLVNKL